MKSFSTFSRQLDEGILDFFKSKIEKRRDRKKEADRERKEKLEAENRSRDTAKKRLPERISIKVKKYLEDHKNDHPSFPKLIKALEKGKLSDKQIYAIDDLISRNTKEKEKEEKERKKKQERAYYDAWAERTLAQMKADGKFYPGTYDLRPEFKKRKNY